MLVRDPVLHLPYRTLPTMHTSVGEQPYAKTIKSSLTIALVLEHTHPLIQPLNIRVSNAQKNAAAHINYSSSGQPPAFKQSPPGFGAEDGVGSHDA